MAHKAPEARRLLAVLHQGWNQHGGHLEPGLGPIPDFQQLNPQQ